MKLGFGDQSAVTLSGKRACKVSTVASVASDCTDPSSLVSTTRSGTISPTNMVIDLGKRGRLQAAVPTGPASKSVRMYDVAVISVVSGDNVEAAIALLRPYLESLVLDGNKPVQPALIALCTWRNVDSIVEMRNRAQEKRGSRLNESIAQREAHVAAVKHQKIMHQMVIEAYKIQAATRSRLDVLIFPSLRYCQSEEHVRKIIGAIQSAKR